ncbi:MAG: hypothetical protein ACJAVS_000714 [Paracoccaceae bacterium]|jgi:hypothetical protein
MPVIADAAPIAAHQPGDQVMTCAASRNLSGVMVAGLSVSDLCDGAPPDPAL